MGVRDRQRRKRDEARTPPSRREQAAHLRSRADALREELGAAERALQERRDADEAGRLEAEAHELEQEQARLDRVDELRRQADELEAAAETNSRVRARALDAEMLEAIARAARFEEQIAGEFVERREELERRLTEAAESGDTDGLLAAERDLGLLPMVKQRLREQASAATARARELNSEAARLEAVADQQRRHAAILRRHADSAPLSPITDPDYLPDDQVQQGGRGFGEILAARNAALEAVERSGLALQDADAAAAFLREHRRATLSQQRLATWMELLDQIANLIEAVRDAANREAHPGNGALVWVDQRRSGVRVRPVLGDRRRELDAATTTLEQRAAREGLDVNLQACGQLATASFEFKSEVVDAAGAALAELQLAREVVAAAVAA